MKNLLFLIALFLLFTYGCTKVYVRRNIYSLGSSDPDVIAYQKGVSVMKQRDPSDPTSWAYQAAIHGTYAANTMTSWRTCQHGSFFFLSWHRIYLYYFERIVRKASGYSDFALPYWNYSDDPAQASLPDAFRVPATASNSLYEPQRETDINAGQPLQPSTVDYQVAFNETAFSINGNDNDAGFGGTTVPAPVHFGFPHGLIESQPHDQVHVNIGGYMSDPNTAALDPIFYLHHANIDRLWERWLRWGGRENPTTDNVWMNTQFTFFDEDGNQVNLSGKDILSINKQLHYKYDDLPIIKISEVERPPSPLPIDTSIKTINFLSASDKQISGRRTDIKMTFSRSNDSLELMNRNLRMLLEPEQKSRRRVVLRLEGITYDSIPSGIFEVYINLPDSAAADYKNIYYAGNIGFFGFMSDHGGHEGMKMGGTVVLNITKTLKQLQGKGIDLKNLNISIIHKGATVKNESNIKGEIKIRSITVLGLQ